ncbi:MAG: hypothetical protein IJW62_05265 [Clostridia bacterium]|nr:hypothetical protein [Clostridia bacterium]
MKRVVTMLLVISMIACMMPMFAISASAAAPEITLDGDLSDWEGLATIESVNNNEKFTFYGVVTEEGLYVAADAYTVGFDPGTGNWWDAPNLEFFVGPFTGDENQRWVSFTNKEGGFVKENNVTSAAVSYETVEGAVTNHAIVEAFIARNQLEDGWFYADGSIRVGMAFDTNNSAGGSYIRPTDTTERDRRALVTADGVRPILPTNITVSTADELIAFVKTVNETVKFDGGATRGVTLNIANDIDLTGKEWAPLDRWIGTIEGNGHTISGMTYVTDAESSNFGLLVRDLANFNAYGTVQNLTIENSTIVAKTTNGYVGGIAGYADRGRVMNCAVENVTVIGNTVSGGIVGGACWATGSLDGQWVIEIINNKVKNSTVAAISAEDGKAGGIAGINYWDDIISLGDYTLENVTLMGKTTGTTVADAQGRTPPQGANATATNVTTNETVTVPALGEGQATKAWDAQNPTEVKIAVTAVSNTLTAVKVNGNTLKASNYTVTATDDGFAVALTESYLKTLKAGSYKIVIETYLGNTQEVTLSVAESAPGTVPVPPTGDVALAAAVVAIVSIFALAAVVARKKRQQV